MFILLVGLMLINVFFGFIDYVVVGSTNHNVTKLTSAISANISTIPVQSTSGWRVVSYVVIDSEEIPYNGKTDTSFLHATRGGRLTDAEAHGIGSLVYGSTSSALRDSVGFNIVDTGASVGSINLASTALGFVTNTLPQMVSWNFYWMKTGFWQYLRLLFFCISGGCIFVIAMQLLAALGGMLQSAWLGR